MSCKDLLENAKIGDGVTVKYYTDRESYTIIGRTKKTLTLQRDKAERKNWKPNWIPGGFSAICTNCEEQEWEITPDPEGRIIKAYWKPSKDAFYVEGCLLVLPGRKEYYDYNF